MGLYRDSRLGLCLDVRGPDGNVFYILGLGDSLARQMNREEEEWKQAVEAAKIMGGNYEAMLNVFEEFFPVVTLIGRPGGVYEDDS